MNSKASYLFCLIVWAINIGLNIGLLFSGERILFYTSMLFIGAAIVIFCSFKIIKSKS